MGFNKSYLPLIVFILLSTNSVTAQSSQSWWHWKDLRWAALEEFQKNNLRTAEKHFQEALAEARRIRPGGRNQAVSDHDLAELYKASGKFEQAEIYCKAALGLSRRISPNSSTVMLILDTLEDLKKEENKYDEAGKLDDEMDKMADTYPNSRTMGAATMEADGTIVFQFRLEGPGGAIGEGINSYSVRDPEYKNFLMHIGPLKPGGGKLVAP
jgi:tetratricopeptide (TPR) repeat protein